MFFCGVFPYFVIRDALCSLEQEAGGRVASCFLYDASHHGFSLAVYRYSKAGQHRVDGVRERYSRTKSNRQKQPYRIRSRLTINEPRVATGAETTSCLALSNDLSHEAGYFGTFLIVSDIHCRVDSPDETFGQAGGPAVFLHFRIYDCCPRSVTLVHRTR